MTPEQLKRFQRAYDALEGRAAAVEYLFSRLILQLAGSQPDPFQFLQEFAFAAQRDLEAVQTDVPGEQGADVVEDTKFYVDAMLTNIISNAGQFRRPE